MVQSVSVQLRLKKLLARREVSVCIALIFLCVLLSILSPYFLKQQNLFSVLRQISAIAVIAVGEGLVIITGGIDLSVGSQLGLMGVIAAVVASWNLPWYLVLLIVLLCGFALGSVNGLLVTKVGITPFIVTLGMMNIARGLSLLITGGMPIHISNTINFIGGGYIGPIPFSVIVMALVAVGGAVFASMTLTGRNIYAVGNNDRAAELSGIRVHQIKILVYALTGALCALAGIIIAGTLNSADPNSGNGYEMDVIAAVILGGTSLSGGEGSIQGVIIGAALMGVLRNAFVLLNISAYLQIVTIGLVIIGAVAIDSFRKK
jgi:ribose transport system permease protein